MRSNNFALQLAAKFSQITLHLYCSALPKNPSAYAGGFLLITSSLFTFTFLITVNSFREINFQSGVTEVIVESVNDLDANVFS